MPLSIDDLFYHIEMILHTHLNVLDITACFSFIDDFVCHRPGESPMNFTTEGCFCPDGMKLFNKESNICVDKCGRCDSPVYSQVSVALILKCQPCCCNTVCVSLQDVWIQRESLER